VNWTAGDVSIDGKITTSSENFQFPLEMWIPPATWFIGTAWVNNSNVILIGSAVLEGFTANTQTDRHTDRHTDTQTRPNYSAFGEAMRKKIVIFFDFQRPMARFYFTIFVKCCVMYISDILVSEISFALVFVRFTAVTFNYSYSFSFQKYAVIVTDSFYSKTIL